MSFWGDKMQENSESYYQSTATCFIYLIIFIDFQIKIWEMEQVSSWDLCLN